MALSKNNVLAKKGHLPWKNKEDLSFFRMLTTGSNVVMGRKTYESIGKPLPKRTNYVLSTTMKDEKGITVLRNINEVLELEGLTFVIGGKTLYEQFLPYTDTVYISRIPVIVPVCDQTITLDLDLSNFNKNTKEYNSFTLEYYTRIN